MEYQNRIKMCHTNKKVRYKRKTNSRRYKLQKQAKKAKHSNSEKKQKSSTLTMTFVAKENQYIKPYLKTDIKNRILIAKVENMVTSPSFFLI